MRRRSEGFTLIELILTIAIVITLMSVGGYTFYDALPGIRVRAAARELFGDIQKARMTAMSTSTTITVTLDPSSNSYTVGSETIPMNTAQPGVRFGAVAGTTPWNAARGLDDGVTLAGNAFTIDRRGRPSGDGEIYLIHRQDLERNRRDRTYCIAVSTAGALRLLRYDTTTSTFK